MKKILMILPIFLLCGCELSLNSSKERDIAIEDCKRAGGTPFVENYDDSRFRPIVHCNFGEILGGDVDELQRDS